MQGNKHVIVMYESIQSLFHRMIESWNNIPDPQDPKLLRECTCIQHLLYVVCGYIFKPDKAPFSDAFMKAMVDNLVQSMYEIRTKNVVYY